MTITATHGDEPAASTRAAGIASWMLFDWAAQPFYTLISIFLFAPHFTNIVIGDTAQGAAIWGYMKAATTIVVALGSPLLGALADARGRIKPLILWCSALFVLGQAVLWYAVPAAPEPHLWIVISGVVLAGVGGGFATMLNSSLMSHVVPPGHFGRVSGAGLALGYIGGLFSLLLLAGFVLTDAATGRTLLGLQPVLTLDTATYQAERLVGPFCAIWYILFVVPFFLFTPDASARPHSNPVSARDALARVFATLSRIRSYRQIVVFLVARMLFSNGLLPIFVFGGIYATSIFGWQTVIIGYFGIILSIAAGIGATVGGFLDDWLGPKRVIIGSLVLLIVCTLGVISVDKSHVLFVLDIAPKPAGGGPFASAGEQIYLAFATVIGIAAGPLRSASRTLLAHMAPPEHVSEFFGFFAFSRLTTFAGPLIIGALSSATGSLQFAMCAIPAFLLAGLAVMLFVKAPARVGR
jgi:UMF1 family MFS transporter